MNFRLPNFTFKAINPSDDVYVDEQGRHIIFRTINGQVVPIKTDSDGYASWLKNQGIDLDPADQKTLRQLDRQLEVFDQARQAGGPELQQQYQKAFEKQLKDRQKLVKEYYQQALQSQAEKQNVSPEKLQKQKEQRYEQNKERAVNRSELEDRGWNSYIKSYTNNLIKDTNADPKDKLFYVFQAFDLISMKALDRARNGIPPSQVEIEDLIDQELNNLEKFGDLYDSRYKQVAEEYGVDPVMFLGNIQPALKILKDNFSQNTAGAQELEAGFDSLYRKMHDDFHPQKEEDFLSLGEGTVAGLGIGKIPEDLPQTFGTTEAASLKDLYSRSRKGSPINKTHNVTLHTLSRLFDSIPQEDRVRAAVELSDTKSGLHAVHKSAYKDSFKLYEGFGMDIGTEENLENILREAVRAAEGTTTDKITAMKRIAHHLGVSDGLNLLRRGDTKGYQSFVQRWNQCSVNAGRAKGEGPDLLDQILDSESREANIYPNNVLKIPHENIRKPEEKTPELEGVPKKEEQKPALGKNEVYPGFFSREGRIYSSDDYSIEIEGQNWNVYSPDNDKIGTVKVPKVGSDQIDRVKEQSFGQVNDIIANHKTSTTLIEEDRAEAEEVREFSPFDFKSELTDEEQSLLTSLNPKSYNIRAVIPGSAYRISQGDKYLDLVYAKDKLVATRPSEGGGLESFAPTQESIQAYFSPKEKTKEKSGPKFEDKQYTGTSENLQSSYYRENELEDLINFLGEDDLGWKHFRGDSYRVSIPKDKYNEYVAYKDAQNIEKSASNQIPTFK